MYTDNEIQQGTPPENKRRPKWWLWLIIAVVACTCLTCAAAIGALMYFGREPEGLNVEYSLPATVKIGEGFDLIIALTNTSLEAITVGDIDLDQAISKSILDGAMVVETDPPMDRNYSIQGIKSFHYNQTLNPNETQQVIFHMQAVTAGEFGGSVGIYVGDLSKTIEYVGIVILEK